MVVDADAIGNICTSNCSGDLTNVHGHLDYTKHQVSDTALNVKTDINSVTATTFCETGFDIGNVSAGNKASTGSTVGTTVSTDKSVTDVNGTEPRQVRICEGSHPYGSLIGTSNTSVPSDYSVIKDTLTTVDTKSTTKSVGSYFN